MHYIKYLYDLIELYELCHLSWFKAHNLGQSRGKKSISFGFNLSYLTGYYSISESISKLCIGFISRSYFLYKCFIDFKYIFLGNKAKFRFYQSNLSSSYVALNIEFVAEYPSNITVDGYFSQDTVKLGAFSIPNQIFGEANQVSIASITEASTYDVIYNIEFKTFTN